MLLLLLLPLLEASLVSEFQQALRRYRPEKTLLLTSSNLPATKQLLKSFKRYKTQVDQINSDPDSTFSAEVNAFSIYDEQEISAHLGLNLTVEDEQIIPLLGNPPTPNEVDWVVEGAQNRVKSQSCGVCWAFAAVSAIEGEYFLATGDLVNFSEQEMVDCSSDFAGCSYGDPRKPLRYIKDMDRLAEGTYHSYRYNPHTATSSCHAAEHSSVLQKAYVTSYQRYQGDASLRLRVSRAPVVALVYADRSFMMYEKGVFKDPHGCRGRPNHAVSVVGYGKDIGGRQFWKIRNSWAATWGESGYMRLTRDVSNHCGISSWVLGVQMECREGETCKQHVSREHGEGAWCTDATSSGFCSIGKKKKRKCKNSQFAAKCQKTCGLC